MRVLVTGGAGQVGSHIAELLHSRGDNVVCIDNLATGRAAHLECAQNLKLVIGSVANSEFFMDPFVFKVRPNWGIV